VRRHFVPGEFAIDEGAEAASSWPSRCIRCAAIVRTDFPPLSVNLRLAEPEAVARIPVDHFDGLDTFDDLPRDGRCVRDYWF
jgi:hypothetical protein